MTIPSKSQLLRVLSALDAESRLKSDDLRNNIFTATFNKKQVFKSRGSTSSVIIIKATRVDSAKPLKIISSPEMVKFLSRGHIYEFHCATNENYHDIKKQSEFHLNSVASPLNPPKGPSFYQKIR